MLAFLDRARADGVELVRCPEALIGELANETDGDTPSTVALSVATPRQATLQCVPERHPK